MTLPHPYLPIVLLSHHGPVSFRRHESGRTASPGAGGLITAFTGLMSDFPDTVWVCAAATNEDAAVVGEHDHQVLGVTLEPESRLLDQADRASQERQVPTVRLRLVEVDRQALACYVEDRAMLGGTRAPRGDGTESPPWSTSWTCVRC